MPTLTPVDGDPFAPAAAAPAPKPVALPKPPKLTPVSGDPFAWADPDAALARTVGPGRITSRARSAAKNAAVGGSPTSSHMAGQAVDFVPADGDMRGAAQRLAASGLPFDQAIDEGDHLHVGYGPKGRRQVIAGGQSRVAPQLTPVDDDPFAAAPPKPAAAAPPKPAAPKPTAPVAPAKPRRPVYNPVGEFVGNQKRRASEAAAGFMEGARQAAPGDGQSADPVNAALGLVKLAGSGWSYLASPVSALADTVIGKPVETATGVNKTFAGDAIDMATGFLVGPKGQRVKAEPVEYQPFKATKQELASGAASVRPGKAPKAIRPSPTVAAQESLNRKLTPVEGDPFAAAAPKAKPQPVLAELRQHGPSLELGAPDPYAHGAEPVVGDEVSPYARVDNAMYRLGGHATADKIQMAGVLKAMPDELTNPQLQEELYHAIEARMVDPNAPIPEHLQPAYDSMAALRDEQTELANRLRERNDPDLEPYLADSGYVPRRAEGYTPMLDDPMTPSVRDPILGKGRSLVSRAQAQKQRTAGFVATDADGASHFYAKEVPETDILDRPYASVRQATTAEIEANTATRYHKNALINTVDNVLRLRQVDRNLQVLDELKTQLKEDGLAHQQEWRYRNDQGQTVVRQANGRPPEGFVELRQFPQLNGWYFDKRIGNILRDYRPEAGDPNALVDGLNKVNRALTASLFITPVPHAANVMAHWYSGRGWDWLTPTGWARLARTGTKAAVEVMTLGPKYQQMLREGSALLYADTQTRNFQKLLMDKAGGEFFQDPKAVNLFAQAAGLPVDAVKFIYRKANEALWGIGDVFMLQRQMELEAKGMSTRKAIHEAERDIPNYRIPDQVMGSRAVAQFTKNPTFMMFGRYKYGQIKAWGEMFKDMLGPKATLEQRVDGAGKFLMTIIGATVAYPMLDLVAQRLFGDEHAKFKRAGGFALSDALYKVAGGPQVRITGHGLEWTKEQKDFADIASSFVSPAPVVAKGLEVWSNRDHFGRTIRTPGAGPDLQAAEAGAYMATNTLYPVAAAAEAARGEGKHAVAKALAMEAPSEKKRLDREKYARRDQRKADKATRRFRQRVDRGEVVAAATKLGKK